jgi:hypothetical protein
MGLPKKAISTILEHAPVKAAEHLPGVNLHVDDSAARIESFNGTDGETDVFVFDAEDMVTNIAVLRNFDAGEDLLLFDNMDGRDLIVGDLDGQGTHLVLFHGNGEGAAILLFGVPHQQQDVLEEMILPFDGRLAFDDPFASV